MTGIWIVTLKFKPHKYHNPSKKRLRSCQTANICSDSTGAHHCFLIEATTLLECMAILRDKFPNVHVTRYEHAKYIDRVELNEEDRGKYPIVPKDM